MATTLDDIHPHIIQTNILPRLDAPSLSTAATTSSYLQSLCSDHHLWSHISKSTWPSITHPRVDHVISTFPAGHRSFFQDSFPALITDVRSRSNSKPDGSPHAYAWPSELISAVDIHHQNESIYSRVEFTDTTTGFLESALRVELKDDQSGISRPIDLKVDELTGADESTLSYLKESVTLSWILIDPVQKRAGNLSRVKPISAMEDWTTNETILQYVTVLPGFDPDEMVICRVHVVFGVGKGGVGLHVREVMLTLHDMDYRCLNGKDFLAITRRAIMEEGNVRRKVVDDNETNYNVFKEMRRERTRRRKIEDDQREFAIRANYIGILVSFFLSVYLYSIL